MSPAALAPSSGHFGHLAMTHSRNYRHHYFMTLQRVPQPYLDNTCCAYPLFFWFTVDETNADVVQQRLLLSDFDAAPVFWYFHLPVNKNQLNTHRSRGPECAMTSPWSWGCFTEDEHSEVTSLLLFIWQTAWDSLSFQCTVYCLDTIVNQHILFDNQYFFFTYYSLQI